MNELKQVAEEIEKRAKEEKDLGTKAGLYIALNIIWADINKIQAKELGLCK